MTFATECVRDGVGRVVVVEVSLDGFSTISYYWAEVAGVYDGTNQYSARILETSPVRRGFGQNRIAASGTLQLVLDNADGALDWLCDDASVASVARARFRVKLVLFDPTVSPLAFQTKTLGEFTCAREWPRQGQSAITLALGDDVLGPISQQAALPTLLDWQAVGTTANNPIKTAMGLPNSIDSATPVQLAFGEDWVLALPHIIPWLSPDAAYNVDHVIVPVCCTTDLTAATQDLITNVRVHWMAYDEQGGPGNDGQGEMGPQWKDVPRTVQTNPEYGTGAATYQTVWTVEKSPTITKDGVDFQIVYLVVRAHLGILYLSQAAAGNWDTGSLGQYGMSGGYPLGAVRWAGPDTRVTAQRVLSWYVKGTPLSAITQQTLPAQHPVDVLIDLATEYSNNRSVTVDTAAAARVRGGNPTAACAGVIQSWTTGPKKGDPPLFSPPPSLRQVITGLCQSADLDLFINWAGEVSFSSDVYDFTVATQTDSLVSFAESDLLGDIERTLPSKGERWATYNRLFFKGGKAYPPEQLDVPYQGPFDFFTTEGINLADRIIEGELEQGWRPWRQQAQAPWYYRSLSIKPRRVVTFRVGLQGLLLDLGQYFKLSWTRGPEIGGPYVGSVFQAEAITYAPGDDTVEVVAVWRDDVTTEDSYLLDDETLLVRSKGALTGSATAVGDKTVGFGGTINLTTMGAETGDILVLRDSSQAADVFTRNGAWRITDIPDTVTVFVAANGESAFPAAGAVVNADWSIVRGATTYPTAVSDPTNYPSGGAMYGKVSTAAGLFSNAEQANKLISG